jgi:hypothetical protein
LKPYFYFLVDFIRFTVVSCKKGDGDTYAVFLSHIPHEGGDPQSLIQVVSYR